jgi:hypothetical protein
VRPRFYVVATCGYGAGGSGRWSCSYAVLDRAYCYREVFTAYVGEGRDRDRDGQFRPGATASTDASRRERCERAAAERNERHEQRMADLLAS